MFDSSYPKFGRFSTVSDFKAISRFVLLNLYTILLVAWLPVSLEVSQFAKP